MTDPRERALGAVLCLGCYHSLWQWSQRVSEPLPLPWGPVWRPVASPFVTVGCQWVLGMIALAGLFLMLAGARGRSACLGVGLVAKLWFYLGDFRLWAGAENLHLVLGWAFLAGRPRLATCRLALALGLGLGGCLGAAASGVTPGSLALVLGPACWWLLPWPVATTVLALYFGAVGIGVGAEFVLVPLGAVLTCGSASDRLTPRSWAVTLPMVGLWLATAVGHPQMALRLVRPPSQARLFFAEHTLDVTLTEVGPGERRVVVTLDGKVVRDPGLIDPRYFQEADHALGDPLLYEHFLRGREGRFEIR